MQSLVKIVFLLFAISGATGQEIYKSTSVVAEFFSSAPIEDIAARADDGLSLWNTRTGEITFRVNIRSFQFEKGKMQEHFNENFMESQKYPYATFKGEVKDQPQPFEPGNYEVMLAGVLEIHGVKQNRKVQAKVQVKESGMELQTDFTVPVAAHDIEIPKILWRNIAEEISVKVHANYSKLDP